MDARIARLAEAKNTTVSIAGWITNIRSSGKIIFITMRDGSGFVQVIVDQKNSHSNDLFATASALTLESSARITGMIVEHPKKAEEYEMHATDIEIIQIAPEYPIGKKEHGPDFLMNNRHLWIRSKRQWAILRIRDGIYRAIETWLHQADFVRFDSPIITPSACEGTTELFSFNYFDLGQAHLSQSGQLYLEAGIASLGRVYDFGPVFRAEKSKTRRHLTEFWMMDAEAAFIEHVDNMGIQEELVVYVVEYVLKNHAEELTILERAIEPLKNSKVPFPRITHADAVKQLQKLGSDIKHGDDLGADDETLLTKQYDRPIFVEKYPKNVKAFYMKQDPEDASRVLCDDMLAPEGYGEIIGGSQREDNRDVLLEHIAEHGLREADFLWYLDTRTFGSVPHSGFGIGLERFVAWICGLPHIRETIPFARTITRKGI